MSEPATPRTRLRAAISQARRHLEPRVWGPGDVTYAPSLTISGDLFDEVERLAALPDTLAQNCPHRHGLTCRECDAEAEAEEATWD